jgi:hypothetical protein
MPISSGRVNKAVNFVQAALAQASPIHSQEQRPDIDAPPAPEKSTSQNSMEQNTALGHILTKSMYNERPMRVAGLFRRPQA